MPVSAKVQRILLQRSGNRCAFPGCGKELTLATDSGHDVSSIAEIAHIVAQKPGGPRGEDPLPLDKRDDYDNLILLCLEHHKAIDDNPDSYPVQKLRRWKLDHEQKISEAVGKVTQTKTLIEPEYIEEKVYSTLLPVEKIPRYIYSVDTDFRKGDEKKVRDLIEFPTNSNFMAVFIFWEKRLYTFTDLKDENNPYFNLYGDTSLVTRYHSRDWWTDPDYLRLYVQLLNRSLNKLTGHKGLNWDKAHKRFYFEPLASKADEPRTITYNSLNKRKITIQVAWQPITKRTGQPKNYWLHKAVSLSFHYVGKNSWCLSLRPTWHVTTDGFKQYHSEKLGRKITKKQSRRYNHELLTDVQFWRDFLSDTKPRIIFPFYKQSVVVLSNMLEGVVSWPGMPSDHAKSFTNPYFQETLFSWMEKQSLEDDLDEIDDEEDWDDEDEEE